MKTYSVIGNNSTAVVWLELATHNGLICSVKLTQCSMTCGQQFSTCKGSRMLLTDLRSLTLLLMCSLIVGQIPEPIDGRQSLETSQESEKRAEDMDPLPPAKVIPSTPPSSHVQSTPSTTISKLRQIPEAIDGRQSLENFQEPEKISPTPDSRLVRSTAPSSSTSKYRQIPEPIDGRQSLETSDPSSPTSSSPQRSTPSSSSSSSSSKDGDVLDDNFHMFRRRRSAEEEEDEEFGQESFVEPVATFQQMFLDSQERQGIREKLRQLKQFKTNKKSHPISKKKFSFFGIVERIYFDKINSKELQTVTYIDNNAIQP